MNKRNKYFSEFMGSYLLLMIIVGSGIMGENLANGNEAVTLLVNSIATCAGLFILIELFGPSSGAHINPAVTLFKFQNRELSTIEFFGYITSQAIGAFAGVLSTNYLFGLQVLQQSHKSRSEFRLILSEFIATLGLLIIIQKSSEAKKQVSVFVALFILIAYWVTPSTSFANPAVTLARSFTDTFTGISPNNIMGFILAQIIASLVAFRLMKYSTSVF